MTNKIITISIILLLSISNLFAQSSIISWQKCLGGSGSEYCHSIQQTSDGGYIITGYTSSNDGDITSIHGIGQYDAWVVKLDTIGNLMWQKCYGGGGGEESYSIKQTTDGGYIIAAVNLGLYNSLPSDDVTVNFGGNDCWIVKIDSVGNIIWQESFGGSLDDVPATIQETSDGGYVFAGKTKSNDGHVSGNHGNNDSWVVKLDATGNLLWQKCLGGSFDDRATSILQTVDGEYVVAGYTGSTDGDVIGKHGSYDYWVVKLDTIGNIIWQNCLGGYNHEMAYSIQQTLDGGFIVAGEASSYDSDVTGNHGSSDYWVVKLDTIGNMMWQKCLGGSADDKGQSIQQTTDGGYIVAGYTRSDNGDVTGYHGGYGDYWVVRLNPVGNITWQKSLGGSGIDRAYSIVQSSQGGFVVAGHARSSDFDVVGNHGVSSNDYWVVKLDTTVCPTANAGSDTIMFDNSELQLNGNTTGEHSVVWTTSGDGSFSDSTSLDAIYTPGVNDIDSGLVYLYLTANPVQPCNIFAVDTITLTIYDSSVFNCGISTISDYDGNSYNTVLIGDQCWMKENLATTHYTDGTPLIDGTNAGIIASDYSTKFYFNYNNDTSISNIYGKLYTWAAAMNDSQGSNAVPSGVQGICPSGWHVPSDEEWKILEGAVDSQYDYPDTEWDEVHHRGFDAGKNLKSISGWSLNGNGTDLYGFSALPAGYRYYDQPNAYNDLGYMCGWWSTNEGSTYSWNRWLYHDRDKSSRNGPYKSYGYSVRCLKDTGQTSLEYQTIIFPQGWSMFSTYMDPVNNAIDTLLMPLGSNLLLAKDYNGMVYYPYFQLNMMDTITKGLGYRINVIEQDTLYVYGQKLTPEENQIELIGGWSIIGYLRDTPASVVDMLSSLEGNLLLCKNDLGEVYWPYLSINQIGDMVPGKGYQIQLNFPHVYTYPSN